ncbi:MAG: GspH/FimT family pseudopilin [Acidobacteriia bacterium]|nr:GspH/FimT family pseudopilin [Terriglobia bacterium]
MVGRNLVKQKHIERGITLLEILVVLTLIAILSAMVYPSFGNAMQTLRLRGEARQLVSACREARWEAIAKRRPFRLTLDPEKNQISIVDFSDRMRREIDLPAGIRIFQAQKNSDNGVAEATEFYFFPNGTTESGSITLRNQSGKNVRVVIESLTGNARIEE